MKETSVAVVQRLDAWQPPDQVERPRSAYGVKRICTI